MNLALDEYVIMPYHIHGIIKIGRNRCNKFDGSRDAVLASLKENTEKIYHLFCRVQACLYPTQNYLGWVSKDCNYLAPV